MNKGVSDDELYFSETIDVRDSLREIPTCGDVSTLFNIHKCHGQKLEYTPMLGNDNRSMN